jgi:hypothetical protein
VSSLADRLGALRRQAGAEPTPASDNPAAPTPERWTSRDEPFPADRGAHDAKIPGLARDGAVKGGAPRSGSLAPEARAPMLAELRERIDQITRARRPSRPGPGRVDESALAEQVGGRRVAPGLIRIETEALAGWWRDTRRQLPARPVAGPDAGAAPTALADALDAFGHAAPAVFLDTETTGLAGGTGTVAFVVGIARTEGASLTVTQWLLTAFHGEPGLLVELAAALAGAATLVTYNGRSFDAPLLQARYRLTGLPDPLPALAHLDLLHPTRGAFGRRWPDCRLQTAERELLGLERIGDIPGHAIPEVWFRWVRSGHADQLPEVIEHNRLDLVALAALLPRLAAAQQDPVGHAADPVAVTRQRLRKGEEDTVYAYLLDNRDRLDPRALLTLARMARRRRDWEVAIGIWSHLATADDTEALECLAKFHEHVGHDAQAALAITRRLADVELSVPRHLTRLARLERQARR